MAFFGNDAVNRVNLHSGIQALARGAGTVFFLVFLLRAGISVPIALLAQAAILVGRFVLRPLVLPLAKRFGLKPLLITGTIGMAIEYPLLAEVHGVGPQLLILIIAASAGGLLYWVSYNAYFAAIGDAEHRGHQVGAREALVSAAGIIAPLLAAWSLVTAGPRWTFAAVGIVQVLSALPLLGIPNVKIKQSAPGAYRAARLGFAFAAIDGWFDAFYLFVWQIALFVTLKESIPGYGGAMALAGLLGAVCGPLLGRHVDAGGGKRATIIAYSAAALVMLLRAASLGQIWLAVIANALGALLMPLMIPPLNAATYNLSQSSPCTLRFQMASEAGWDVGCFSACVLTAGLAAAGLSLGTAIVLALPAIAAGMALLLRYNRLLDASAESRHAH